MKRSLWLALVSIILSSCNHSKVSSKQIAVRVPIKSAVVTVYESDGKPKFLNLDLWNDYSIPNGVGIYVHPTQFDVAEVKFKIDSSVKEAIAEFPYEFKEYRHSKDYYKIPDKNWGGVTIVLPNQYFVDVWQKALTQVLNRPKKVVVPEREIKSR